MGTDDVPTCKVCSNPFEPEAVYERLKADFEARVGFAYSGRRPPWVGHFCSEPCRYLEERARAKGHNDQMSARRARRRSADRGDP